jgi:hypothetical protein
LGDKPGSLLPKIEITGTSRLAAMCTGPESLEIKIFDRFSRAPIRKWLKFPESKTSSLASFSAYFFSSSALIITTFKFVFLFIAVSAL